MNEAHRSLGERLMAAQRRIHTTDAPSWADRKELKAAGAAAEEHCLLMVEQLSRLFATLQNDEPLEPYRALGGAIAEFAVLGHIGMEARRAALDMLITQEPERDANRGQPGTAK